MKNTALQYVLEKTKNQNTIGGANPMEKAKVSEWLSISSTEQLTKDSLKEIDKSLLHQSYLASPSSLTLADLIVYYNTHPIVSKINAKDMIGIMNYCRWFNHIQYLPLVRNVEDAPSIVTIDTTYKVPLPKKSRKQRRNESGNNKDSKKNNIPAAPSTAAEAATEAGKGGKKGGNEADNKKGNKKENKKDNNNKKEEPKPVDDNLVCKLDIRVGLIRKVWVHPKADKLYCEEIEVGKDEVRKISSGLRPYFKLEELENRRVLVLCNLKEKSLVEFKSHGMVLCASSDDHSVVKFLEPPADAPIGERVKFEGLELVEPETENHVQKKKIFEGCAPDLHVGEDHIAKYKTFNFMTSKGPVTCPEMTNAHIS